jgi:hypothetical protein
MTDKEIDAKLMKLYGFVNWQVPLALAMASEERNVILANLRAANEEKEAYIVALQHIANGHLNPQQFAKTLLAIRDDPDLIR